MLVVKIGTHTKVFLLTNVDKTIKYYVWVTDLDYFNERCRKIKLNQ